jgi:NarL family two-component system response regulator LiaR
LAHRIRVMLVDDHEMVRRGLAVFLETVPEFELVGQAANGQEAITLCPEFKPDVILMDLMMPEVDGLEATRQIRNAHPEVQVVVLSTYKDHSLVQETLRAGATGYLLKNASMSNIAQAIHSAYNHEPALAPEVTQLLIEVATQAPIPSYNLTDREKEVLGLMAKGLSNPQIAEQLALSRFTVKTYVSYILSKLGVTSRSEAVALALQGKLVQ